MISRRRLHDASEQLTDRWLEFTASLAFPGRGTPLPPVLFFALPKSGSIYLQRALRRTLKVQTRHIGGAGITGSSFRYHDLARFARGNVVSREHSQPRAFMPGILARFGVRKAVVHVRDPRGAIVSWAKHMDRILANRGIAAVELSCERVIHERYAEWDFSQRLDWQVRNMMPQFVAWIEGWLEIATSSKEVEFLVTDYKALSEDARGLVTKILDFHEIEYKPEWVSLPVVRVGKNNIFTMPDRAQPEVQNETAAQSWASAMSAETRLIATDLLPASLSKRFGWVHP